MKPLPRMIHSQLVDLLSHATAIQGLQIPDAHPETLGTKHWVIYSWGAACLLEGPLNSPQLKRPTTSMSSSAGRPGPQDQDLLAAI